MSDEPVTSLEVNFGDNAPALGSGLSFLSTGPHTSVVERFALMKDRSERRVLYAYMVTPEGEHHRQKFWPDQGPMFLAGFLVSAGVSPQSLQGRKNIPLDRLVGKTVYFDYTPPDFDGDGRPVQGTYADYTWYTKERWLALFGKRAGSAPQATDTSVQFSGIDEDEQTPPPPAQVKSEPKPEPKPEPKKKPEPKPEPEPAPVTPSEDFSFLDEGTTF